MKVNRDGWMEDVPNALQQLQEKEGKLTEDRADHDDMFISHMLFFKHLHFHFRTEATFLVYQDSSRTR